VLTVELANIPPTTQAVSEEEEFRPGAWYGFESLVPRAAALKIQDLWVVVVEEF
jgi:hypothetical protein